MMMPLETEKNAGASYDDEEAKEEVGLLGNRVDITSSENREDVTVKRRSLVSKKSVLIVSLLVSVVLFLIFQPAGKSSTQKSPAGVYKGSKNPPGAFSSCRTKEMQEPVRLKTDNGLLRYACPCQVNVPAANLEGEDHLRYTEASQKVVQNVSNYLQIFRNMEYDDWGRSYNEVKKGMSPWKQKYFSTLQDGDAIYESACGTGMNLFMTLEILKDTYNIKNLTVYGNEYFTESVGVAREIVQSESFPGGATLGTICPGDSTHLRHVPSNSFDLVFTGYIAPLVDPLHLGMGSDENFNNYTAWCLQSDDGSVRQRRKAQNVQNRWYADWVGEMIRIAKPGAPVIAEQVSYPLCDATFDWGGVNQDFWKDTAGRRKWDIDVDSIEFQEDVIFRKRYHVFMRKNA